jgi:hypothetical protein
VGEWDAGTDWVRRWRHKVKVKRPSDIKRSRVQVSPEIVQEFFTNFEPNLAGVTAAHFFNYDDSSLKDDPGAEDAFFSGNSRSATAASRPFPLCFAAEPLGQCYLRW